MHLKYQAAAYKAQDLQDELAIPVFGLAIAAVATGIAQASTAAIAGTGLGGAAGAAGVSYLHPDKDAATDQAATAALLCVVDQSKILNDTSAIPLVLDKAALQDALNQMRVDAGPLLTGSTSNQPAKAAVQAVEAAAESSMHALDSAIAQYVALPGEIFQAADTIDQTAQTSGARSFDYSSVLKSLQASSSNQSSTEKAKFDLQKATDSTGSAGRSNRPGGAKATTLKATTSILNEGLTDAQAEAAPSATKEGAEASQPEATSGSVRSFKADAALVTNPKEGSLLALLGNPAIGDLTRVNMLAKEALDDIPNPNFAATAAAIKTCSAPR
ncbi:MAG: hypothetical protein JOZ42_12865 [Acetobacteraceae bacterium]|nr:hypothetical protein [Acetobacteraceae bacterium]